MSFHFFTKKHFLFFIFIIIVFFGDTIYVDAKKTKKKKKIIKNETQADPEMSSKNKPYYISPTVYCHICKSVVEVAIQELKGKKDEISVTELMEGYNLCKAKHYKYFKYDKGAMSHGCTTIVRDYELEFEKFLIGRHPKDKLEYLQYKFCGGSADPKEFSITRACYNVRDDLESATNPDYRPKINISLKNDTKSEEL